MDVDDRLCPSCGNWVFPRLYALPRRAICPRCESNIPDSAPRLKREVSSLEELAPSEIDESREQRISRRIAEKRRGDDREILLARLLEIGVDAELAGLGSAEEDIGAFAGCGDAVSLGLILIAESPIELVNVVRIAAKRRRLAVIASIAEAFWGEPLGSERVPTQVFELLVPDAGLKVDSTPIRAVARPAGLLAGAETARRLNGPWRETAEGMFLRRHEQDGSLEMLVEVGTTLVSDGDSVEVLSHPADGLWSISLRQPADSDFSFVIDDLTSERWAAFESLAKLLSGTAVVSDD